MCGWNQGRSNGLIARETSDDSWQSIFWDYFELKASMDGLEKRADKIQDGLTGLIRTVSGEKASVLNQAGFMFSIIILPFTVVASIYSSNLQNQQGDYMPERSARSFVQTVLITWVITFVIMLVMYFQTMGQGKFLELYDKADVASMRRWMKVKDRRNKMSELEKNWQTV
jgi:hypothetical protein